MAQADSIENDFSIETTQTSDGEGVVNFKNYQQPEEKEALEMSAFEQVMLQMNIADRTNFDKKYAQMWGEASDAQEMLSVIICEIDFFNEYNENYGHQASSFMLLVIALALKTTCEEHRCYLARYKGNEFGILVKGENAKSASAIAEKLRFAVEKSRTEHKYSSVSDIVTLSIGLSSVYPTSMQTEMKQAATALNSAKMSGCNQISSSSNVLNHRPAPSDEVAVEVEQIIEQQEDEFPKVMKDMGINNRIDFDLYFVNVWEESTRDEDLLSMLVCELDFFNEYAEHYGVKQANDITLVIALALKEKCDEIGCFLSYENNQFSIIIHGGNATKGLKVSEAMKNTLKELKIEHLASSVKDTATMSIGLSNIFPSELNTMKILESKVHGALKVAKSNGYDQLGVEI